MEMTDVEVICNWMEPKPINNKLPEEVWESAMAATLDGGLLPATPKGWWGWVCVYEHGDKPELRPTRLNLDRLWEVEERLTVDQCDCYLRDLAVVRPWRPWHADAAQKIKALAHVIRTEAGSNS